MYVVITRIPQLIVISFEAFNSYFIHALNKYREEKQSERLREREKVKVAETKNTMTNSVCVSMNLFTKNLLSHIISYVCIR